MTANGDYASSLLNVGIRYHEKGDYTNAERYYLRASQIYKISLGENHPNYATSLDNLGNLYREIGNYEKAEQCYLQSLTILKTALGERHPDYASTLNNLGNLYRIIGEYARAEQCYLQSSDIIKTVSGENHPDYASSLNNLGNLYRNIGDYSKAEQCYLQSLDIIKLRLGENHPAYASSLNNLGLLYNNLGDYTKAEQYYLQASDACKNAIGENHPNYATSLNNLGNLYRNIGEYSKAEQCYEQALKILKNTVGEHHPDYAFLLNDFGTLYYNVGNYSKAELYLLGAQETSKSCFLQSLDYMSEQQRNSYWSTIRNRYESTYPKFTYRFSSSKPSVNTFAYNNELFTKGLLLNSSNAIRLSIAESGDATLIRQWEDLTTVKQQIMALQGKNPQSPYIAKLQEEAETLEKDITRSSASYRENLRQWNITWDSVRAALKPNQVAIEYMRTPLNEDSTMYCALLLRDTSSCPIMIPLFEEKEVTNRLHLSTSEAQEIHATYAYHRQGRALLHHVWGKVLPYLHTEDTIFFAPTGVLHQLAIENLPFNENSSIGEHYNIVRLSSTRELALSRQAIPVQTATLYGDIYYQPMDSSDMVTNARKFRGIGEDAYHFANDTTRRSYAANLPGSKVEIESIRPILADRHIAVSVYSQDTACEESFKALSGTPQNILLLSTHGFFWTEGLAKQERYFSQYASMPNEEKSVFSIDPLSRCGLLFSGANTALSGHNERLPKGVDDGILTAKEISVLDFRKTDIVVLSACETGLGDISGEGVFGLQRAFKMAGVQTLLMTLWKVNDRATQLFMTAFFRHYSRGENKRDAFCHAQQEVRNYTETDEVKDGDRGLQQQNLQNRKKPSGRTAAVVKEHPYASPYYWAGFILLD